MMLSHALAALPLGCGQVTPAVFQTNKRPKLGPARMRLARGHPPQVGTRAGNGPSNLDVGKVRPLQDFCSLYLFVVCVSYCSR